MTGAVPEEDSLVLRLMGDLRSRARLLRWIGNGFIGAVIVTVADTGVGIATAGTNYDQVTVGGGFDAGGGNLDVAVLNPALSNAPIGSTFVIVQGSVAPIGTPRSYPANAG